MRQRYALILAAASLLTVLPLMLLPLAGDWIGQAAFIQCFDDRFWHGDLYPRWCFNADAGLGLPLFLFYFPLPFYITALLYPLTWLGIGIYPVFIICCFLATLVTAFAAYGWLKDIVSPKFAVLATILLLLVPYRMELLLYRIAYAELWAVALMPLLFARLRRLAMGQHHEWRNLAWIYGAMALCHLPVFFAAAVGSAIYMIIMTGTHAAQLARAVLAGGCAVLLAAFFIVPAWYYKQYIFGADTNWSLDFLDTSSQLLTLTIMLFLSILALAGAASWLVMKRKRIDDGAVRREILAWSAILAASLFLVFPVSSFFHAWLGPLDQIAPPRRMQSLLIPCTGYFAAILLHYFASRRKTWKADYGILVAFLMLAAYGITGVPMSGSQALIDQMVDVQYALSAPFRAQWIDGTHWSAEYVLHHAEKMPPRVAVITGDGDVKVERWDGSGIGLSTHSGRHMRLKLDHTYFPVWQAISDEKIRLALSPEQGSGSMLLDVPAGTHHILLHPSIFTERPQLMGLACLVSLITALALLYLSFSHRRFNHSKPLTN